MGKDEDSEGRPMISEKAIAIACAAFALLASSPLMLGFAAERAVDKCFLFCELQTIGREFEHPTNYFLVHYCAEHDREHLEPIPERVYFEMRDNGLKELRR